MYDEWGNDIGTAPTWFLTDNGEPSPFDVDATPPLSVASKGEDPLVLPGPTGESSLKLLDDPFVLPGPDSDYGFGLKRSGDDWLVPLSNPGESTLPPIPPVTGDRTQPTTPSFWNPYDGGFDGHDSDPPEPPPPPPPPEDDCAASERRVQLNAEYDREIERANGHIQTALDFEGQRDMLLASTPGHRNYTEPGERGFQATIAMLNAAIILNYHLANNAFLRAQEVMAELQTLRCR